MKPSTTIKILSYRIERSSLVNLLSLLSSRYKREIPPDLPTRKELDEDYRKELGDHVDPDRATTDIAATMHDVHEASRTQRDFSIINAGRKRLMKACLDATLWRMQKLDRQIEAAEKTAEVGAQ